MKRISLQVKIGLLMLLAILLISAAGYLSFRSLSSIVSSIRATAKPDLRLLTIREISADFDKAENSVRMYTHTRNQNDAGPYYAAIAGFDAKIDSLRAISGSDPTMLRQIDTISDLLEEDILIWNEILDLYHNDSLDNYIRKLTARLAVETLSRKDTGKSILRRVFTKRAEKEQVQREIILNLNEMERQDSIRNKRRQETESQLILKGKEIRDRFNILIAKMEDEVVRSISRNAKAADRLAMSTYRWLAMFSAAGTLLSILVLIMVTRYARKARDYQIALVESKEETENLARTRELFVANMSHEIRTPVNAISGLTEQLLHRSFDEKSRKILEVIQSSSDHLVRIVNDILDFSKLQHASLVLESSHFRIHDICREVQLLFEKNVLEKNNRLSYTISQDTPGVLLGDPYRLKQILLNLVGNAVKFTSGGEIRFSVDSVIKPGNALDLVLQVSDTGIGISGDMQEKVFDDFTQAENDTSGRYGGTGLGLSIVKKLVDLHGGTVDLKSRKNEGTTVTCTLPYMAGNKALLPASGSELLVPVRIRNMKFLVVDDEEYNRLLFRTIFERWQVAFDEAADGRIAIEQVKKSHYDLVFMDYRMPGLDGMKSSSYIREVLKISEVELPIVGISATADDKRAYRKSGMNTFLVKPFTEKMLMEVIVSVLDLPTESRNVPADEESTDPLPVHSRIDLNNMYHLADQDKTFVRQMLIRFIEGTELGLEQIRQAAEAGDMKAVMETAHRLSAPCRHIGAGGLYSLLKAIEKEALNHGAMIMELFTDSRREFEDIRQELNEHIVKMKS